MRERSFISNPSFLCFDYVQAAKKKEKKSADAAANGDAVVKKGDDQTPLFPTTLGQMTH